MHIVLIWICKVRGDRDTFATRQRRRDERSRVFLFFEGSKLTSASNDIRSSPVKLVMVASRSDQSIVEFCACLVQYLSVFARGKWI